MPQNRDRDIEALVDGYRQALEAFEVQRRRFEAAQQRLCEYQERLLGDGSTAHREAVLAYVQDLVIRSSDSEARKRHIYVAMMIKNQLDEEPSG